jgi:hypothetical protein
MKQKIILLLLLIFCIVFVAGCLDKNEYKNSPINPLHKNIERYKSSFPVNAPQGKDIILYNPWGNYSIASYDYESLMLYSDIAFYGTIKNIGPSCWSTIDQKIPSELYDMPTRKITYTLKNGTQIEYNDLTVSNDAYIYTPIVFEVKDLIKGKNTTIVTVIIYGGQVDNYIMCYYPETWDLQEGQEYLVYLKGYDTKAYVMHPGLFVVLD